MDQEFRSLRTPEVVPNASGTQTRREVTAPQKQDMAARISSRQLLHAGVEGYEKAAPLHRLPEQQSIRPLLMSSHSCGHRLQDSRKLMVQGPELMSCMACCFAQDVKRGLHAHRPLGHGGIGEQAQHAKLRQCVGGPSLPARLRKPSMRRGMASVAWPDESQQNVDIRQMPIHSSSRSSRTCSLVITGKSFGASKTGSPWTFLVAS